MSVVKLEISNKTLFQEGQSFGKVGPYHLIEGIVHFSLDPCDPNNELITDIELAPLDSNGLVQFSSDFAMLQPVNKKHSNQRILFDVLNRGKKTVLMNFNSAIRQPDPSSPLKSGNGHLMEQGYTIVWCGWQADVPPIPGLMGLHGPNAVDTDNKCLEGQVLCWIQEDEEKKMVMLSHRGHLPYPPSDINDPSATLAVRNHPNSAATTIPRTHWSFVRDEDSAEQYNPSHVYMPTGFKPGKIYELVYQTRFSRLVGLGLAAVRDIVSYLKYSSVEMGNPCSENIKYAYAFGSSQSGRFLRQLIHLGLNNDEQGRMALDGIIAHVAGAMRGEFNQRYGQPSKDICFIIPELFPFTDFDQTDPVTGETGSLLQNMRLKQQLPKLIFTNTSAEYWRGDAALIHTDLVTMSDAPEDTDSVRKYHFSGTQHGIGDFPPLIIRPMDNLKGQLPFNSIDYTPLLRAVLSNLDQWVSLGQSPPPSRHPKLSNSSGIESHKILSKLSELPGVKIPKQTTRALRLDYGNETHMGRTIQLPAIQGEQYPAIVSAIDDDGNEIAGIRLPDIQIPLATYTGWNLRHPDIGNADLYIGISGGLAGWTLPFPATDTDRANKNDPRRSIKERYHTKTDYLDQITNASRSLLNEGYILEEDLSFILELAERKYDLFSIPDPSL